MDTADDSKQTHKTLLQARCAVAEALEVAKEGEAVGAGAPRQSVWLWSALERSAHSRFKKQWTEITT